MGLMVSRAPLIFLALLMFAASDLTFGWKVLGPARAALVALAAGGGVVASAGSFWKHRKAAH